MPRPFSARETQIMLAWIDGKPLMTAAEINGLFVAEGFPARPLSSIRSKKRHLQGKSFLTVAEPITNYRAHDAKWDDAMAAEGRKREGQSNVIQHGGTGGA